MCADAANGVCPKAGGGFAEGKVPDVAVLDGNELGFKVLD